MNTNGQQTRTVDWGMVLAVGDYIGYNVGSHNNQVLMPVKVIKLNNASVKLENGDTLMCKYGTVRNLNRDNASFRGYSAIPEGVTVAEQRALANAAITLKEERDAEMLAEKQTVRQLQKEEDQARQDKVTEENRNALRNYTTTTLPDGTIMHITQLTNTRGESKVYMFTVAEVEDKWGNDNTIELQLATYGEQWLTGKGFRNSSVEGKSISDALLNALV